ncbi:tRNA1(Val) (adenine(37)-N6)-methyltransferase [Scandinavium sp. V105_16]|uniref:tRNA1(Val) (adenine(37)-N6)-methyltransferase n=1 Tax=Scandinavium lactucae TaxID=3095028 RepID=A0AAJ2S798_9ENTR|nr:MULTISPECIES: tRNA1(Val) (adenine(37)-N6)-methyltransferase [unclassified Scandinavium]MDX6020386.1 tRNA1(Val) (adenine(37)-N6)-methyltransferase [Scandinavium sp. V105_16]MDX6031379.1 tRNA1(Val) (adenine(37)-N6)-methyltransferase [Scandinavium sp. V105_12]
MSQPASVLRRNGFTFKQFFVAHDRCAMKVGTDGILLGAWAPIARVKRILDIGTGSGLLALMLAQRTESTVVIDAVELDADAAEQAAENVAESPWANRIQIHTADVAQWLAEANSRYDLIISNPPYYAQGVECATPEREQARYTTTLDHVTLLNCAASAITEEGFFCVVLPEDIGNAFSEQALAMGWHLRLRTDVAETDLRPPHRVLLAFSPRPGECFSDRLTIRGPEQQYSEGYTALTQAFYLFM